MAGIYIHIPFCRKLCNYCDFYRTKQLGYKDKMLVCLLREIEQRKEYLKNEIIETIYIGGGTPSVLSIKDINNLLKKIYSSFEVNPEAEITIEANPDDLTGNYLKKLGENTRINRLSIGIQSFIDRDLMLLNRRHNSVQAIDAVVHAINAGFSNISIDLIYAIPGMTFREWESNLLQAFSLNVKHLSAYHLTYEPNTVFYNMLHKKIFSQTTDEESIRQFSLLIEIAEKNGFEHYEISNFSWNGFYSKHNTNYWQGQKYLGIGPSAHSYNQVSRQWNIPDNSEYIKCITSNEKYAEIEFLDLKTRFNEYVMTGLRTKWGINLEYINNNFGDTIYSHVLKNSRQFIISGKIFDNHNIYTLSGDGQLIADYIISELFA